MRSVRHTFLIGALAGAVLCPASLLASGFSIFEQGGKASGLAGAYVALADDASANWYNPANLVWMEDRAQFQFGINLITAGGDTEFEVQDPAVGVFTPTVFEPESSIETPIHLYYTRKVNSNIAWGFGITTPFGLVTDWETRPISFAAQRSDLATFVFNPNIAFRLTESWSVAVGVDYMFADVRDFSREVPIELDGNPFNGPEVIGFSNLTGDGDDWGWNVATSFRTSSFTLGLTYRSGFEPEIEGNIDYENFGPLAGLFPDSPGSTPLGLPAQAAIGLGFNISSNMTLEFNVAYAEWSAFDELDIDIENETPGASQDFVVVENWDDTYSYRVGLTWDTAGASEWRFGAVFDESPVPEEYLRPSIPDADRTGLTLGYGHDGRRWIFDTYYMALWFDEITAVTGAPESEGVIAGTYDTFVHLAGASLTYKF
ncbi:MAG: outer membrane protein transport protein [Acidobacteriota bacterium]